MFYIWLKREDFDKKYIIKIIIGELTRKNIYKVKTAYFTYGSREKILIKKLPSK